MRHKYGVILILVLILFSCTSSPSPEVKFDKHGVSFTCPKGWKITDETNLDGGYYMSVEKDGFNSSGLLSITWVNDSIELAYYLDMFKEELKNNIIYKNSNLEIQGLVETKYNGIEAIASNFTASILGLKHEGMILCMYGPEKTVGMIKQEALEDKEINKDGFGILQRSFLLY